MGGLDVAELQAELRSPNAPAGWEAFLSEYSPVLYQIARAYTNDEDDAADCFLHICESLARNGFRRLLKFKPGGSASFTTWLRVVARNLCFDLHRKRSGRWRPFKSLQSLSPLELDVYDCRFGRGFSAEETLHHLRPTFPSLDLEQVVEVERRIEQSLNSRQRWMLSTRQKSDFAQKSTIVLEEMDERMAQLADVRPDQESLVVGQQQQAKLERCVTSLPADERLLLRLRFEEDLSLDEIARLTRLGDAQRAHRRIQTVLNKLRAAMK